MYGGCQVPFTDTTLPTELKVLTKLGTEGDKSVYGQNIGQCVSCAILAWMLDQSLQNDT